MQDLQAYNRKRRLINELENKIHEANMALMSPYLSEGTREAMEQSIVEFHEEIKELE